MDTIRTLVGRAIDSLLPPPHGVRQTFEATDREFWSTTEVEIPESSPDQVLARMLEPWDRWWSHSRAGDVTREGSGMDGRLLIGCFEPLVMHAQALQRARHGIDEALARVPLLRAMVQPRVSKWLDRFTDDGHDFSAARLQLAIGPAEALGDERWRIPVVLQGDFEGPFSFELEPGDSGTTLREHFGDPLCKEPGHGVVAHGRVKNPFGAAMLHLCTVASRIPGLDGMGYLGLRQAPAETPQAPQDG